MSPIPLEAPLYVLWEITLACNLRCRHCAARAGSPRADELTLSEAFDVCDQLADLGTSAVCLMGGEPLVRKDWFRLADRLRARGVEVGLITNGWNFNSKAADTVQRLDICQVGVSLDAADPGLHDQLRKRSGAHARALSAIRRVAELPLTYRTVITSVSRTNLSELDKICDLLAELAPGFTWMINISSCHDSKRFDPKDLFDEEGFLTLARFIHRKRKEMAERLQVTGTHDLGYYSKQLPDLHDFQWTGCVAGLQTLGIRSNGDITGCLVMDDTFIEGNLRQRSLADLWADPDAFAYNRRFTVDMLQGACAGCDFGEQCRGGCRDHAVSFTGSRFDYPFCLHRIERDAQRVK
jgi:radical SAM protein with 4Fe4S-binding SPASM domain